MINAGERLIVNNRSFGYLSNRIVFYLLNLHIKSRHTYFARVSGPTSARCPISTSYDVQYSRLASPSRQTRTRQTHLCHRKEKIMRER